MAAVTLPLMNQKARAMLQAWGGETVAVGTSTLQVCQIEEDLLLHSAPCLCACGLLVSALRVSGFLTHN